jgi:hypothetical protein
VKRSGCRSDCCSGCFPCLTFNGGGQMPSLDSWQRSWNPAAHNRNYLTLEYAYPSTTNLTFQSPLNFAVKSIDSLVHQINNLHVVCPTSLLFLQQADSVQTQAQNEASRGLPPPRPRWQYISFGFRYQNRSAICRY